MRIARISVKIILITAIIGACISSTYYFLIFKPHEEKALRVLKEKEVELQKKNLEVARDLLEQKRKDKRIASESNNKRIDILNKFVIIDSYTGNWLETDKVFTYDFLDKYLLNREYKVYCGDREI